MSLCRDFWDDFTDGFSVEGCASGRVPLTFFLALVTSLRPFHSAPRKNPSEHVRPRNPKNACKRKVLQLEKEKENYWIKID